MGENRDKQQTEPRSPADLRAPAGRKGWRAGAAAQPAGRSSSLRHLLTPHLPERPEGVRSVPPAAPHTLPAPEPSAAATGGCICSGCHGGGGRLAACGL